MNLDQILSQVIEVAKDAGSFIKNERKNFNWSKVEQKQNFSDLVSYVDKEAEGRIISRLKKIFPEAGFIAEEGEHERKDKYNWIIDPLDGTTNFLHNLPVYSTSIALVEGKKIILGVVYEINQDECFYAIEGGEAYCNGEIIKISPIKDLTGSLIATGFPYSGIDKMKQFFDIFDHFMKNTHGVRRLGSAAVDLAYIAAGRVEGFYEFNLHPWDVAGGAIIIQQAGGTVTDFNGGNNYLFGESILAGGHVHGDMLNVISKYWH